jgi:glycosyltransferase involved in cell wall biosynthesis
VRVALLGIKTLPALAGADRVVEQFLDHASDTHEYTVYLVRDRDQPTLQCVGNRHYVYVPALRGKHTRAPSYFLSACAHYLLRGRQDVVHVHNSDFGVFIPVLRLRRGTLVVGTLHGDPYLRRKWGPIARRLLRLSEWVFMRSCDVVTSVAPRSDPSIVTIPNGFESGPESDAELPPEIRSLRDGFLMFACGRLDSTKGAHHLLAAYKKLADAPPLLVIGDFGHDPAYSARIDQAAAQDSRICVYRGLLKRAALFSALRRCSIFIFPSEIEAMSMMLLEAIASDRLVVCSDIPENVEVVGADYPFLFRSRDTADLERVLARALSVPDGRALASDLRKRVAAKYQWPAIAARYEQLYERAR